MKITFTSLDGIKLSGIVSADTANVSGAVILCHGITADKDESGKFRELSQALSMAGLWSLRFDFRGHGESDNPHMGMTISGEIRDFEAAANYVLERFNAFGIVAASFGAAAAILYSKRYPNRVRALVLWNPVLDYYQTFFRSKLPWGQSIFNERGYRELAETGFVTVPGKNFRIGKLLVEEMSKYAPYEELKHLECPVLTIHCTRDTKVPYSVSQQFGKPNSSSEFLSVESDHGFGDQEKLVIRKTVDWLRRFLV